MKKLFILFSICIFGLQSWGDTIKVKKVKGTQAVVEFQGNLEVGQTYQLGGSDEMSMDSNESNTSHSGGARKNLIGFGLDYYNYTTDPGGATTGSNLVTTATYGWNKGSYEYGPSASLAMSGATTTTTTFGVGGFFDYNFSKHRPGTKSLFAVGINGQYKSSSGGAISTSTISVDPGVSWRYFAFGDSCIRIDGAFHYASQSGGSTTLTQTGPHIYGSLVSYF